MIYLWLVDILLFNDPGGRKVPDPNTPDIFTTIKALELYKICTQVYLEGRSAAEEVEHLGRNSLQEGQLAPQNLETNTNQFLPSKKLF